MEVSKTFDASLVLKDAGAITSSGVCTVDGSAKILDIGGGAMEADIVIDVSAIELETGDERYVIGAQISDSATFASGVYEVCALILGSEGTAIATSSASTSPSHSGSPSYSGSVSASETTTASKSGSASPWSKSGSASPWSASGSASYSGSASRSGSASNSPSYSGSVSTSVSTSASTSASVSNGGELHGDTNMGTGRYILPFRNTIADNVTKRYMRLYVLMSGAAGTGINFSAYLAKSEV